MPKYVVTAKKRDLDASLKKLRSRNILPANMFGSDQPSTPLALDVVEFKKLFLEIGESGMGYIKVKGESEKPVMIDEIQLDPVTNIPIHASFKIISLTEKTTVEIPVELVGEFELPEAVLVTVRDEIEVRALPTDLPEKFVVNVEGLEEIGQAITLADLEFNKEKVEIVVGDEGLEAPVVLVQEVEEEPEEPEEPIETEIIGEEEEVEDKLGEEEGEAGEEEVGVEQEPQPESEPTD